jgi:hypothetical protein
VRQTSTNAPAIPFKRDASPVESAFGGGAAGLLAVSLIVIVAVLWVRKRLRLDRGGAALPRHLKVLETERLGPRALLSVVEFGGTRHLLAHGEHGVSCIASVPAQEAP